MEEGLTPFEEGEAASPDLSESPANLAALGGRETVAVDPETVRQAMGGDKEAFTALYRQTYHYTLALIFGKLDREEDRRDALQETYSRVWAGLPRLREPGAFLGWLKTIALAASARIYNSSFREEPIADTVLEESFLAEEPARETALDVREVLNGLPEEEARLLMLVFYDGMSLAQIARMQSLPASTVRSRFARAKKKMLAALKERGIARAAYSRAGFITTVATAMRDAVGTELLSAAVAQNILDGVLKGDGSPAGRVAEQLLLRRRNKAVMRATTLVIALVAALAVAVSAAVAWAILGNHRLPSASLPAQAGETESAGAGSTLSPAGSDPAFETVPTEPGESGTPSVSGTGSTKRAPTETAFTGGSDAASGTDPTGIPAPTEIATTKRSWLIIPTLPSGAGTAAPHGTTAGRLTEPTSKPVSGTASETAVTAGPTDGPAATATTAVPTASAAATEPTTASTVTEPTTAATTIASQSVTQPTEPAVFVPDYRPGHANAVGSEPIALIRNEGRVAKQDDWIYLVYEDPEYMMDEHNNMSVRQFNGSILKVNLNTKANGTVYMTPDRIRYLSVVGDWMYFETIMSSGPRTVKRIRTDGSCEETLLSGGGLLITVRGQEMFFWKDNSLMVMDIATGTVTQVAASIAQDICVWVSEQAVYYITTDQKLYAYENGVSRFIDSAARFGGAGEDTLYYLYQESTAWPSDWSLKAYDHSTGQIRVALTPDKLFNNTPFSYFELGDLLFHLDHMQAYDLNSVAEGDPQRRQISQSILEYARSDIDTPISNRIILDGYMYWSDFENVWRSKWNGRGFDKPPEKIY